MSTIVTRAGKGSPLTHVEVDANFTNLNTDKVENGQAVTFATIDIATSGTDAEIAPNTGITGWNYSGLSKSVSAEELNPTGLFLSPNGLNMYVNGFTGDDVNQYTLSTAFDVSTATFVRLFSTSAQDSAPSDVFFKPDGLSMFIMGQTNDTVFQYTLSSAFDISTASYASKSFSVASQETTPTGLWFKPDGTVMYVIGSNSDTVFQYTLSTAWDVSTASYANISFDVSAQEGNPQQVNLSADGLTMWILGTSGDDISQYALGTAFNVSTAVFENSFYIGFQETGSTGLFIDSTAANRVYIVGTANDTVFQYNTATNSISAVTDVFNTTSNARVQGNLAVQSNAYVDGTLVVQGTAAFGGASTFSSTLTASSTITLQGTTTSTIALGTSVTSGTISVGGTSGTGTITVGQSTVSQTTNIQAGATASGSTKTLNIGTAGVSGSTTAINIGSAVSGATSTTTLSGLVIDSISAAVSAAGTTQGTATGLVSNINNVTVVTAAAAGVRLPTAVAGMRILVRNSDSADTLSIYPATGGTINALSANAAFTLAAGATIELVATTTTQWYTF
jgi:sugar lactone lactonase YvrE